MERIEKAYKKGNSIAEELLLSYSKAEFFTKLPDIPEEIEVVTYVAGVGDISTDLLSPGADAHSRADRELHGQSIFDHNKKMQKDLLELQSNYPDKKILLVADKGTMGVGSSRMSGVNNVALWIGEKASKYVPFINIAPIVGGTNGISPIFMTTVDVTGGIGLNLKNWEKTYDKKGDLILNENGEPILKRNFQLIQVLYLLSILKLKNFILVMMRLWTYLHHLLLKKLEFMRAGGSYQIVFGKKLQTFAANTLKKIFLMFTLQIKKYLIKIKDLLLLKKFLIKILLELQEKILHAGSHTLELR